MPALWGPQIQFALHILGKNLPPALLASRLFDLTGSTAMITGGAQGIGAAVALGMAHSGADIIIAGALAQWAANEHWEGRGLQLAASACCMEQPRGPADMCSLEHPPHPLQYRTELDSRSSMHALSACEPPRPLLMITLCRGLARRHWPSGENNCVVRSGAIHGAQGGGGALRCAQPIPGGCRGGKGGRQNGGGPRHPVLQRRWAGSSRELHMPRGRFRGAQQAKRAQAGLRGHPSLASVGGAGMHSFKRNQINVVLGGCLQASLAASSGQMTCRTSEAHGSGPAYLCVASPLC